MPGSGGVGHDWSSLDGTVIQGDVVVWSDRGGSGGGHHLLASQRGTDIHTVRQLNDATVKNQGGGPPSAQFTRGFLVITCSIDLLYDIDANFHPASWAGWHGEGTTNGVRNGYGGDTLNAGTFPMWIRWLEPGGNQGQGNQYSSIIRLRSRVLAMEENFEADQAGTWKVTLRGASEWSHGSSFPATWTTGGAGGGPDWIDEIDWYGADFGGTDGVTKVSVVSMPSPYDYRDDDKVVTFSGGGGSGADAVVNVGIAGDLTFPRTGATQGPPTPGSGYTSDPTATIAAPVGGGTAATLSVSRVALNSPPLSYFTKDSLGLWSARSDTN
jgi:hypothetical protein